MSDVVLDLFDDYQDTAVISDKGAIQQFANMIERDGEGNVLVFTGGDSIDQNQGWQRLLSETRKNQVSFYRYVGIDPEPDIGNVEAMIEFMEDFKPTRVVAIGGGSILDAAKAAYLVYQAGGKVADYFGVNKFSEQNPDRVLERVACFPTTSGTGSEVTQYSNIYDKKLGVKKLIVEDQIIPQYSFLIPELTSTMPHDLTLTTACDALAHSIEGLLNTRQDKNHPVANKWAMESIRLVLENLPVALKTPKDMQARRNLAYAACLGGMVIRYKSTGLPHVCSFSWAKILPHGFAATLTLPYFWVYYISEKAVAKRTLELAELFQVDSKNAIDVIAAYKDFLSGLGLKTSLKDCPEITRKLVEKAAAAAAENRMKLELCPKPVPVEDAKEVLTSVLEKAWEGDLS